MKPLRDALLKLPTWAYGVLLGLTALAATAGVTGARRISQPDSPPQLSFKDWKKALLETKDALSDKNMSMIAAGVSYFSSLAFFPLVAAAVAIAFFVITPDQIEAIAGSLGAYLPQDMANLLTSQLTKQAEEDQGNLLVATVAILISLFSASGAVDKLIKGLSIAYDTKETRGFIKLKLLSIALTLAGILVGFIVIGLVVLNSSILAKIGLTGFAASAILVLRWLVLAALISVCLSVLFRYGPDRPKAKWQWVSWGAVAATIIWMIGTALFFLYVQNFANFTNSYSVFAGIIILMMWLNLSALIVLVGAQVNHRLETKTTKPKVLER